MISIKTQNFILLALLALPFLLPLPLACHSAAPENISYVSGLGASNVKISPDAVWVSWTQEVGGKSSLLVKTPGGRNERVLASLDKGTITNYKWIGANLIACLRDDTGAEKNQLFFLDIESGEKIPIKIGGGYANVMLQGKHEDDIYIIIWIEDGAPGDVYKVNTITHRVEKHISNTRNVTAWINGNDGRVAYAKARDKGKTIIYKITDNGDFVEVFSCPSGDDVSNLAAGPGNQKLYLTTNANRNTISLISIDNNGWIKTIFKNDAFDVNSVIVDKDNGPVAVGYYGIEQKYRSLSTGENEFREAVKRNPQSRLQLLSTDEKRRFIVFKVQTVTKPAGYSLYDTRSMKLSPIFPDLVPAKEGAVTLPAMITARDGTARDGQELLAYVTFPPGNKASRRPLVVLVHGGPWSRDYMEYDNMTQMFAVNGAFVLRVNYRGSAGFGKRFLNAGNKQWGRKMQDDITDAVKWIIGKNVVDTRRIAIVGGSYGGYAALMGLITEPELFRCGVSINGIVDPYQFLIEFPKSWELTKDVIYERIGDPKTEKDYLDTVSPLHMADKIKKPVLIIQGRNDARVKKEMTDAFVEKLRHHGTPVEYEVYDEGHFIKSFDSNLEMAKRIMYFLGNSMTSPNTPAPQE
jgi:dipeptidyl aminopeptidase/acylaminoacyl peptidase